MGKQPDRNRFDTSSPGKESKNLIKFLFTGEKVHVSRGIHCTSPSIYRYVNGTGAPVVTAEIRSAGIHRADTFMLCMLPEKRAGRGSSLLCV